MTRRRIMVCGVSGSGKTTLSRRIAADLGVPAIELDALFHLPGWQETPRDEFRAKVTAALDAAPDGWVTDGNYTVVRDIILARADTVVWLRPPWIVSFSRLLKRTVTRAWRKEELWNTNRESFRLSFTSRNSILLWSITHHRAHARNFRRDYETFPHNAELIELHGAGEVETFLEALA
jgi:adenylate kinase family enzyme